MKRMADQAGEPGTRAPAALMFLHVLCCGGAALLLLVGGGTLAGAAVIKGSLWLLAIGLVVAAVGWWRGSRTRRRKGPGQGAIDLPGAGSISDSTGERV